MDSLLEYRKKLQKETKIWSPPVQDLGLFVEGPRRPQIWFVASPIEQVPFNSIFVIKISGSSQHYRKGEPYFTEKTKLSLCVDPDYHILGGLGGALDTMKLHQ